MPETDPRHGSRRGSEAFAAIRVAAAVLDEAGRIVGWSDPAEQLLGFPAAEVLGLPAARLLAREPPSGKLPLRAPGWQGCALLRRRDGRTRRLLLHVLPLGHLSAPGAWNVIALDPGEAPWWGLSRAVMEELFTRLPIGLAMLDPHLRYVWTNEALARLTGVPRERRLGHGPDVALPPGCSRRVEGELRQVLATGVPISGDEYRVPTAGGERVYSTFIFRLEDATGRVTGVCYLLMDVSERFQARERLAVLSELGECAGHSLDVPRTAQEIADTAVPRLADYVGIDLLDSVLHGGLPVTEPVYVRDVLRRVAQRSVAEGCPESTVEVGDQVTLRPLPASPTSRCLTEGEPLLESVLDPATSAWIAERPGRLERTEACGLHSVMVVPLCIEEAILGTATFARWRTPTPFTEDDLLFALQFASRGAVSLDRARRFTREHRTAVTLQRSLLPDHLGGNSAADVAWRYLPAGLRSGVGGDWCDTIPLSGSRIALVVGDVPGQGLGAAAAMGRLRTAVRTLADLDMPPEELLARLDDVVLRLSEVDSPGREDSPDAPKALSGLGASCLYAVYDPVSRRCTLARAAHPPPAVVAPDGQVDFPDLPPGPPLGLGGLPFESVELTLRPGSVLALYTNGLVQDRRQDIDTGMSRLATVLAAGVGQPLDALCETALRAMVPGPPSDDAALLLARTCALREEDVTDWQLPDDPAVVAEARSLSTRQLLAWGLADLRFTTELIVSELVTNAIRYGTPPISLRLIRTDVLGCEVADTSSSSPRLRHARTTDEGGRGLHLVAQLSTRWGTRYTGAGKVVWSEQALPAASSDSGPVS